ncbi:hypothetical protein FRC09_007912 [Ceratobasidium sp. 395]|nr:hypothetical protein FRC09_007912 [Ceratobasidium sp. 395]
MSLEHASGSDGFLSSASESGSSHTTSTLQSAEVADYFRSVFGYTFSADENVPLLFPTDTTAERLDVVLHIIVRICRDGMNVPTSVDEMLRTGGIDGRGVGARVLDMVTNSGTWASEMAGIYSTARFTSLDTKPLVSHKPHARISYEVYNFYAGIMEQDATFDLVHLRRGVYATKDFNLLLRELHRVLKPNGFLLITDLPAQSYEDTSPLVPLRSSTYIAQCTKYVHDACEAEGADITAWKDMTTRLEPSHLLWDNIPHSANLYSLADRESGSMQAARGFYDIILRAVPVPLGAWPSDESQKVVGGLVRLWAYHHAQSALPIILSRGVSENQAKDLVEKMLQELADIAAYRTDVFAGLPSCLPVVFSTLVTV